MSWEHVVGCGFRGMEPVLEICMKLGGLNRERWIWRLFSWLLSVLWVSSAVYHLLEKSQPDPSISMFVYNMVHKLQAFLLSVACLTQAKIHPVTRTPFRKFLQKMEDVDKEIARLGVPLPKRYESGIPLMYFLAYLFAMPGSLVDSIKQTELIQEYLFDRDRSSKRVWQGMIFKLFLFLVDWLAFKEEFTKLSSWALLGSYYFATWVAWLLGAATSSLVRRLTSRVRCLRRPEGLPPSNVQIESSSRSSPITLLPPFLRLVSLASSIASTLSLSLFLDLSSGFLISTADAYFVVVSFIQNMSHGGFSDSEVRYLIVFFLWFLARIYDLYLVVSDIGELQDQMDEYSLELYDSLMASNSENIFRDEKVEVFFALRPEVRFTGAGFFSVNKMLLHSMAATATTYIVILIQFTMESPANCTTPANQSQITNDM